MTAKEGLDRIESIIRWARTSGIGDAVKLKAVLASIEDSVAHIRRNRHVVVPEGFVLAALAESVSESGGVNRVTNQAVFDWVVQQARMRTAPAEHKDLSE